MVNENKIINLLKKHSMGFIGDDACVIPKNDSETKLVITKDILVESIHFRTEYYTPKDLAHKSLHVNLSDLAAMGAKPAYIMCGVSIPAYYNEYIEEYFYYFIKECKNNEVIIIGGDTTASKKDLFISITAFGYSTKPKLRSNAQIGDYICLIGEIGLAHLGLLYAEENNINGFPYLEKLLRPNAKTKEGIWLGQIELINSMIDVSDGLYVDLYRLCKASGVGALINLKNLYRYLDSKVSMKNALEGGEDYSILFTLNSNYFTCLNDKFFEIFGYNIKYIGDIVFKSGIEFIKDGELVELECIPFSHFGEDPLK